MFPLIHCFHVILRCAQDLHRSIGTSKGYTGQYNDSLTGLDYYGARYYDPALGVFLSADKVQRYLQGMNPYGYVDGNSDNHSGMSYNLILKMCSLVPF